MKRLKVPIRDVAAEASLGVTELLLDDFPNNNRAMLKSQGKTTPGGVEVGRRGREAPVGLGGEVVVEVPLAAGGGLSSGRKRPKKSIKSGFRARGPATTEKVVEDRGLGGGDELGPEGEESPRSPRNLDVSLDMKSQICHPLKDLSEREAPRTAHKG